VTIRGYVDQVEIVRGSEQNASHWRSYEREGLVFDLLHCLVLLEAGCARGPARGCHCRRRRRPGTRHDRIRIRCHAASGAVPDRTAATRLDLTLYRCLPTGGGPDDVTRRVPQSAGGSSGMSATPQILLGHHLKALRLPTFLRAYDKVVRQCAPEGVDHARYLLRLAELEMIDREQRLVERCIRAALFPAAKSVDSYDFTAVPTLNKTLVARRKGWDSTDDS
jgi:hypothetical protein